MANGNGKITFKDLYELVDTRTRDLENKIDKRIDALTTEKTQAHKEIYKEINSINTKIANFEGKASMTSVVFGYILSIGSILINIFIKQK